MSVFLGIDTSNYTTSAALVDERGLLLCEERKFLPTRPGAIGLRQSDALFEHVKHLPKLLERLFAACDLPLTGVGASTIPRDTEGSYMPCFLAGEAVARGIAVSHRVSFSSFSHQAGHIVAAAFSANREDLLDRDFLAFHLSGGTTEAVFVHPERGGVSAELIARSLDLKAGQLVDRVGKMLGLPFPAGAALDKLARTSGEHYAPRVRLDGSGFHLSGVENQCAAMLAQGLPAQDIARFALDSLSVAIYVMLTALRVRFSGMPVLFAGGVSANTILREKCQGEDILFADPAFSGDNAYGAAVLTARAAMSNSVRRG